MARKTRRGARDTAPSVARPTGRLPFWSYALLLALVGASAYVNGLDAPFVFDDADSIVNNRYILKLWPLTSAMRAPVQSAVAGRPIVSLSLALSYAWNGLSPSAFRATNVAVLVASSLLLFGILRRAFRRVAGDAPDKADWTAFGCALIWVLHPLQTEVVGYVVQRTESIMGLFYLLTVYASVRVMGSDPNPRFWTAVAVVACALGMGSKESMVTAPLMVLFYDLAFEARSLSRALTIRRTLYVGLAATWLVLAVSIFEFPRFRSAGLESGVGPWTYLLNQAVMIVTYLKLAVWPHPLVLDYGRTTPIAFTTALPFGLVVIALLAATLVMWRIRPALGFLGTWFFVILAPTSTIVPIATEVGAERRMHLPLAAIVVLLALAARWAAARWLPNLRRAHAMVVVAVLAIGLGAVTMARNAEYRSPIGIWETVLARRPQDRARYNLGIELKAVGRTAEAVEQYRRSVAGEPAAHYALGFELGSTGQYDAAVTELREFIRLQPDDFRAPRAYYLLGRSLVGQGKYVEAEQAYREILRMIPRDADARGALADVLLAQKRYDEAIAFYKEYLTVVPRNADAHHNLGLAFVNQGQDAMALREFQAAVDINPNDASLQQSLGNALVTADRFEEAVTHFRAGLRLTPNDPQLMAKLALTLAVTGQVDEPLALFRRGLELAPNDPDVRRLYEAAMAQWKTSH
jgi:protein O-mannosyl-transferase